MDESFAGRWLGSVCENWQLLVLFVALNTIFVLLSLLGLVFATPGSSSHFIAMLNLGILSVMIGSAVALLALCVRR